VTIARSLLWPKVALEPFALGTILEHPAVSFAKNKRPIRRRFFSSPEALGQMEPNEPARWRTPAGQQATLWGEFNLPAIVQDLSADDGKWSFGELNEGAAIWVRRQKEFTGDLRTALPCAPDRLALSDNPTWRADINRGQRRQGLATGE
jgi:hypothetical protein